MQLPVKGCFSSHEAAAMANSSLARSSEGGARRRVPFPEVVPRHPSLAVPLPLLQHLRADSRFGRTGSAQPNIEDRRGAGGPAEGERAPRTPTPPMPEKAPRGTAASRRPPPSLLLGGHMRTLPPPPTISEGEGGGSLRRSRGG
ncbi:unnamed protein product [Prorocentrum cordatum]|uniref:Uncharacterized protein n=1 Tax=Prorocentrum cordatum TaxID=2364126 RepID=A0ABN9R6T4_9DINO|nr:unnamed protein product [Polarella glacialis]